MPLVRHRGRAGRPVLHVGVPELEDRARRSLRVGRTASRRDGDDGRVRARRAAVRRAERRAGLHVRRGRLLPGGLRDAGRGRHVLEHALRGWRGGPLRVAEGPLRRVVADRPDALARAARRSGSRHVAEGHGRDAADAQARHRRAGARTGSSRTTPASEQRSPTSTRTRSSSHPASGPRSSRTG